MAQTIKIKRGSLLDLAASSPSVSKGELILATGSLTNGLSSSLFIAPEDNTLRLPFASIESISDGAALAGELGLDFTGLLIHSASDNKLYRFDGAGFNELPIAAGSFVGTLPVTSGGTGLNTVSDGDVLVADANDSLTGVSLNSNGTILVGGATPAAVAGATLAGDGLKASVGDGTLTINIEPNDFAGTGLEDDGSDNLRLTTQGNGIAGGAGTALSVQAGNSTIVVDATGVQVNTGSIASGQNNLVDSNTINALSASLASDITTNVGSVGPSVANRIAVFDAETTVTGSNEMTANLTFDLSTGLFSAPTASISQNLTVGGDLVVQGTTTTIDSTNVDIGDRILTLNTADAAGDAGLAVHDTNGSQTGSLLWDTAGNYWKGGLVSSEKRIIIEGASAGTANNVSKFSAAGAIVDSTITDDGTDITLGGNVIINGSHTLSAPNAVTFSGLTVTDSAAVTDEVLFVQSDGTVGQIDATATTDVMNGILGYTDGLLTFSTVIDGGTF